MPEIVSVNTLENNTLDILLSNESQILLELAPLIAGNHDFSWLGAEPFLPRPKTDGKSIYWPEGPCLSLADIFTLLGTPSRDEQGTTLEGRSEHAADCKGGNP